MKKVVTFKDEGEQDGVPMGPVYVIDLEARDADPNVGVMGLMPFGYEPDWLDDRGWMVKPKAIKLARRLALPFEES